MISVLILGVLVGIDNLQIASAIGMMGLHPRKRWMLVTSFVLFEVTMPLVGLSIGKQLNEEFQTIAEFVGPCILIALGAYIIVREIMEKGQDELVNKRWMIIVLPLLMSLDNLLAGIGLGTSGYPVISASLAVGICAGVMSLVGVLLGDRVRKLVPKRIELVSGTYMIALAVFLIILD